MQRARHWSLLHSNKQWTLCWIFMAFRAPRWYIWGWTGGKTCQREQSGIAWRTVNPVAHSLTALLFHSKSTARRTASSQFVLSSGVTNTQCRKTRIHEINMRMFYIWASRIKWDDLKRKKNTHGGNTIQANNLYHVVLVGIVSCVNALISK